MQRGLGFDPDTAPRVQEAVLDAVQQPQRRRLVRPFASAHPIRLPSSKTLVPLPPAARVIIFCDRLTVKGGTCINCPEAKGATGMDDQPTSPPTRPRWG